MGGKVSGENSLNNIQGYNLAHLGVAGPGGIINLFGGFQTPLTSFKLRA